LHPDRIILGVENDETKVKCENLFNQIDADIITMNIESAEMVKHGINSFLAMSVVFTDQLTDICSHNGADVLDVVKGIKSDSRIGKKAYMTPGIGFSGGTLGRDLRVLQKELELSGGYSNFFENIYNTNYNRLFSIINEIQHHFGKLKDKTVGVLGLTYKPNTSTIRRSLSIEMINTLFYRGVHIIAYDPMADYSELDTKINFEIAHSIEQVINSSDITVIMTPWDEIKNFDYNSMGNIRLFDARLCADKNKINKITYKSI
jgi:UDPglucose 6-dehydrogenase